MTNGGRWPMHFGQACS